MELLFDPAGGKESWEFEDPGEGTDIVFVVFFFAAASIWLTIG